MPTDDVTRALLEPANEPINWAIGDLLRERLTRDDYHDCPILQHLETGAGNLHAWNELFRRTRNALASPDTLPRRARQLLRPSQPSFEPTLDDFIAEMLAAQYLRSLGHENIRFFDEGDSITADLDSSHDGTRYITEAKNLREPNSLSYVAFARWHRNRTQRPEEYNFTSEFVELADPFDDLTPQQTVAVRTLVDTLPGRERPGTFVETLPGNRRIRVRLGHGNGLMLRHGPGPFLVNEVAEECQRAVVLKLMEVSRKALIQLYATAVPVSCRRLLFVRWKPPEEIGVIGEAGHVRDAVQHRYQSFLRDSFQGFAIVIAHTYEDLDQTPVATWE